MQQFSFFYLVLLNLTCNAVVKVSTLELSDRRKKFSFATIEH